MFKSKVNTDIYSISCRIAYEEHKGKPTQNKCCERIVRQRYTGCSCTTLELLLE